jgi:hypothetical protein
MSASAILVNETLQARFEPLYKLLQSGPKGITELGESLPHKTPYLRVMLSELVKAGVLRRISTGVLRRHGHEKRGDYVQYQVLKTVTFRRKVDTHKWNYKRRVYNIFETLHRCQEQYGLITGSTLGLTLGYTRQRGSQLINRWVSEGILGVVPFHYVIRTPK